MYKRNKSILWKTKGIVMQSCFTILMRYVKQNKAKLNKELVQKFCEKFQKTYAHPLLLSILQIVLSRKHSFVGRKCLMYALKYL